MPSESDHLALANKNHSALEYLRASKDEPHSEWVVTVAFYKAVQVVQAIFAKIGRSCHDHKSRHAILKSKFPDIWKHYRVLWQASTIARYLHDNEAGTPYTSFDAYCPPDRVSERFIERRLRAIEQLSVKHLSDPTKLVRV
jgi:hypothetical protein